MNENIGISRIIDQSKAILIGHQVYYQDGSNKFFPLSLGLDKIIEKSNSELKSIVTIHQVGEIKYENCFLNGMTMSYSTRKLSNKLNNLCTCKKPKNVIDGGYCYAKNEKGELVIPCEIGFTINDILNNSDIKG